MRNAKKRALELRYLRAVRAFERAKQQELEATYRLNVARNSADDLIRRLQNAENAGNHPLAVTLELRITAAMEQIKQLTKIVVACLTRIGSCAIKMRETADKIGNIPN